VRTAERNANGKTWTLELLYIAMQGLCGFSLVYAREHLKPRRTTCVGTLSCMRGATKNSYSNDGPLVVDGVPPL
jgi:hypothetical protein